jgi:hypothetical protein
VEEITRIFIIRKRRVIFGVVGTNNMLRVPSGKLRACNTWLGKKALKREEGHQGLLFELLMKSFL